MAEQKIPPGKVAYALPVGRYSGVAWAIRPGDHVDVIISLLVVDLDEEFQTILPNNASCVQPPEGEGCQGGVLGRLEVLPNGWVVNLRPSEEQRPGGEQERGGQVRRRGLPTGPLRGQLGPARLS